MVTCPLCHKDMGSINYGHLKWVHGISTSDFKIMFPNVQMVSDEKREKTSKSCKASAVGSWRKGASISKEQKECLSRTNSGANNPFFGKKHSTATRLKMSENHADFNGDLNPLRRALRDPLKRKQYAKLHKTKWDQLKGDEERFGKFRETVSLAVTKAMLEGKCKSYGRGHEHGWFESTKQAKSIYYRSSYELDFLKWCEMNRGNFRSCPFSISYVSSDGSTKQYLPDFLVDEKYVVEIKPKSMLLWDVNVRKAAAAGKACHEKGLTYCIVTKEDIENGCASLA